MRPTPRTVSPFLLALGLFLLFTGCSEPKYAEMSEKDRASKIKDLRQESERQLALYNQSNDLATLESHADLERESTKVSPTSCGVCFFRYGAALSRLGKHYKTLALLFERDLKEKELSEDEKVEYQEKAAKYRELA